MGHKLTPEEKRQLTDYVREREQPNQPDERVLVELGDEIDDDGKVEVRVVRTNFRVMPDGWKPGDA